MYVALPKESVENEEPIISGTTTVSTFLRRKKYIGVGNQLLKVKIEFSHKMTLCFFKSIIWTEIA